MNQERTERFTAGFAFFAAFLVVVFALSVVALTRNYHDVRFSTQTQSEEDYTTIDDSCYIRIYDSEDFESVANNRLGTICIERVIGVVEDSETGDGRVLSDDSYISYKHTLGIKTGDTVLSYMVYNPDNNEVDDIIERFDYIIDRPQEFEVNTDEQV